MILIYNYTSNYADQCQKLYEQSLSENEQGFIQDISYHGRIDEQFEQIISDNGLVHLAIDKRLEKVVGFGALKPNKAEDPNASYELVKLHVDKEFQGQGFGRKIVTSLLSCVETEAKINLHVTKTQEKAINLYKNLGFETVKQEVCTVCVADQNLSFDTLFMQK